MQSYKAAYVNQNIYSIQEKKLESMKKHFMKIKKIDWVSKRMKTAKMAATTSEEQNCVACGKMVKTSDLNQHMDSECPTM